MIHSLLEIVNAILVAYFATEVLLSRGDDRRDQQLDLSSLLKQRRVQIVGGIWLSTNVLTAVLLHISSTPSVYRLSRRFLVPLVVLSFFGLTWWDVRRSKPDAPFGFILKQLFFSVVEGGIVLPAVSIVIAIAFLALVGLLDAMHVSTAFLNNPIYYGVLYGPLATVYFFTKRRCLKNKGNILPL